jgi:hypothetical protein
MILRERPTLIKRIYHPYWKWEECKYNMWGRVKDRKDWLQKAVDFTGDHLLYGKWMVKVVNDWKYSCEHNLSDIAQNRQAWIGHAAVAYAIQCPEDIVRQAWGLLTEEQQILANEQADSAILLWEGRCLKKD